MTAEYHDELLDLQHAMAVTYAKVSRIIEKMEEENADITSEGDSDSEQVSIEDEVR